MPSTILSDNGASSGTAGIKTTGSNDGQLALQTTTAGGTATTALTIDTSQNVGIGTTSPAVPLHVYKTSGRNDYRIASGSSSGEVASVQFYGTDSGSAAQNYAQIIGGITTNTAGSEAGYLTFETVNSGSVSERMRINSSGNVGIGTSSVFSGAKLQVSGGSATQYVVIENTTGSDADGNRYSKFYFRGRTSANAASNLSSIQAAHEGSSADQKGYLSFHTNGGSDNDDPTERARITSGGYFKASDNGTYNSSTGSYHEFNQSAQAQCQIIRATNGSYNSSVLDIRCSRAASADYYLIVGRSSDGTDTEFYITGAGNAYADGTWNNNGADYAEFFESANGQALTLGATVVLDGNKVREATPSDPASAIIGVVRPKEPSKASMVVGNTAWNKWANKYLTDDFDRYIMEDHDVVEWEETITDEEGKTSTKQHSYESHNIPAGVTVPADATRKTHDDKGNKFQHYKLNPAWDKDAEYVNRENRPEWNIIGLVGQVKVLKGQPVNERWIKMRDVSATVEEWFIR